MNSLVNENIPLSSTINYLSPFKPFQGQINDVVSSINSAFMVYGGAKGEVHIVHGLLDLISLKQI